MKELFQAPDKPLIYKISEEINYAMLANRNDNDCLFHGVQYTHARADY
jgi:hypothetical protein